MEYTQKTKSHALQPQFSDISERVIRSLDSKVPKLAACENDKCYDITDGDDDHEGRNQQLILPKTHDTP